MDYSSGEIMGNPNLAEAALPRLREMAWESTRVLNRLKIYRWRVDKEPLCGIFTVAHRLITGEPIQILSERWDRLSWPGVFGHF
jgi:hypothetical protein